MALTAVTNAPASVSATTRTTIESLVALCVIYGGVDEDNAALHPAVHEVTQALVADAGHPLDSRAVHDAFVGLVAVDCELDDFNHDPDAYLGQCRLPQTTEQRLRKEADLRSERKSALERLFGCVS